MEELNKKLEEINFMISLYQQKEKLLKEIEEAKNKVVQQTPVSQPLPDKKNGLIDIIGDLFPKTTIAGSVATAGSETTSGSETVPETPKPPIEELTDEDISHSSEFSSTPSKLSLIFYSREFYKHSLETDIFRMLEKRTVRAGIVYENVRYSKKFGEKNYFELFLMKNKTIISKYCYNTFEEELIMDFKNSYDTIEESTLKFQFSKEKIDWMIMEKFYKPKSTAPKYRTENYEKKAEENDFSGFAKLDVSYDWTTRTPLGAVMADIVEGRNELNNSSFPTEVSEGYKMEWKKTVDQTKGWDNQCLKPDVDLTEILKSITTITDEKMENIKAHEEFMKNNQRFDGGALPKTFADKRSGIWDDKILDKSPKKLQNGGYDKIWNDGIPDKSQKVLQSGFYRTDPSGGNYKVMDLDIECVQINPAILKGDTVVLHIKKRNLWVLEDFLAQKVGVSDAVRFGYLLGENVKTSLLLYGEGVLVGVSSATFRDYFMARNKWFNEFSQCEENTDLEELEKIDGIVWITKENKQEIIENIKKIDKEEVEKTFSNTINIDPRIPFHLQVKNKMITNKNNSQQQTSEVLQGDTVIYRVREILPDWTSKGVKQLKIISSYLKTFTTTNRGFVIDKNGPEEVLLYRDNRLVGKNKKGEVFGPVVSCRVFDDFMPHTDKDVENLLELDIVWLYLNGKETEIDNNILKKAMSSGASYSPYRFLTIVLSPNFKGNPLQDTTFMSYYKILKDIPYPKNIYITEPLETCLACKCHMILVYGRFKNEEEMKQGEQPRLLCAVDIDHKGRCYSEISIEDVRKDIFMGNRGGRLYRQYYTNRVPPKEFQFFNLKNIWEIDEGNQTIEDSQFSGFKNVWEIEEGNKESSPKTPENYSDNLYWKLPETFSLTDEDEDGETSSSSSKPNDLKLYEIISGFEQKE